MIYAFLTLLSLAAGAVILCCLAWTCGALLFVLALCKSAKLGDDAAKQQNQFKDLKGETTAKARGGNDAAPQLLSMNPKILRGFKTSLAVLLVASVLAGCGDAGQITIQGGKVKVETQQKLPPLTVICRNGNQYAYTDASGSILGFVSTNREDAERIVAMLKRHAEQDAASPPPPTNRIGAWNLTGWKQCE